MSKKLFLLDGMALVYRAHFALIARPILTSKGVNTSALYGFTQTLLEILREQEPTHIAVAFDTDAPTQRHAAYKEYKATRQDMPEDLSLALPHVRRMLEAFRIPVLTCDGYEADDIIGTLVTKAVKEGFVSYMVTPDKDFAQLVAENIYLYRPGRMGDSAEIMGVPEVCARWGVDRPEQVVDVLALMGDSVDNIPGVPGIGEKTAIKLIRQFGTVENLVARTDEISGKLKESLEKNREAALLSKQLATILCETPCDRDLDRFAISKADDEQLKALFVEFEFNSIGRRLFGNSFKAGRGYSGAPSPVKGADSKAEAGASAAPVTPLEELPHEYSIADAVEQRKQVIADLLRQNAFCFKFHMGEAKWHSSPTSFGESALPGMEESSGQNSGVDENRATVGRAPDPVEALVLGIALCWREHSAVYVPFPAGSRNANAVLEEFRAVFEAGSIRKTGYDLKYDLVMLLERGIEMRGALFDVTIAHSLVEPDMRHSLDYISESLLGRSITATSAGPVQGEFAALTSPLAPVNPLLQRVDVAWQVQSRLESMLKKTRQEKVFYEVETPLVPVLANMEREGVRVDARALADFSAQLLTELEQHEKAICLMAGQTFNLNSPRQLGQVLFDVMKICEAPKKTRTGQYSTDEQTLQALATDHEIVQRLLDYRAAAKLKSTYADALPQAIRPRTGRVHTTYNQVMTSTGRLNSQNPNLQNIPIRTDRGQEIRKAFVPRNPDFVLLSADYSQIELRIIAALSREPGLMEAFRTGQDIHTATAAKVYGVASDEVSAEMRRKAKMVNYGIAYGISAFGLAQRLGIPRREGAEIIEQYFRQFAGIREYMDATIEFARRHGYVETVTGRRRYLRDINSRNATVRGSAERNAINMPIQGTAADMIKIAMIRIHGEMVKRELLSRMLLQVHDELVFDVHRAEEQILRPIIEECMRTAIALEVPIVVEIGSGATWLEAH